MMNETTDIQGVPPVFQAGFRYLWLYTTGFMGLNKKNDNVLKIGIFDILGLISIVQSNIHIEDLTRASLDVQSTMYTQRQYHVILPIQATMKLPQ